MSTPADDLVRIGYAEAADLVAEARREADRIIDEAQRQADSLRMDAEADAAGRRHEGELYLQKARAVLEIAQQRAEAFAGGGTGGDTIDLTSPAPTPEVLRDPGKPKAAGDHPLPGEFDRLLIEAVDKAVRDTVAESDKLFIGR